MRTESPKPLRNGGYLHRLIERDNWHHSSRRIAFCASVASTVPVKWAALTEQFSIAATDRTISRLATQLSVSADSLRRLSVGWDGEAFTFPMRDVAGAIVGIRRRYPNGRKLSVKGGREGLFIPTDTPIEGELLICEGPTDTAALLTLGFAAMGRPSCTGGSRHCIRVARGRVAIVVMADADAPGQRGAAQLAATLRLHCQEVRVVKPPIGIKDARAWVQAGATRIDVERAIEAASPLCLSIRATGGACEVAIGRTL